MRRRVWQGWTLHTRLMIVGTIVLIVVGVGLTAALEWHNPETLAAFDNSYERFLVAWFQGVTTRTAGFNTKNVAGLHESTSVLYIALMLIGRGSTSTAGGIKIKTFIVLLLATHAFFRRQSQIIAFGRSIGFEEILKVMALLAITLAVTLGFFFASRVTTRVRYPEGQVHLG